MSRRLMNLPFAAFTLLLLAPVGIGLALAGEGETPAAPDIVGAWKGTWGPYDPFSETPQEKQIKLGLDCKVTQSDDGGWQAVFEGECGRPYKYTIQMDGRQAGEAVLFKGTVDLGEEDGGVYDWIGRASGEHFVGFYTSQKYTGTFQLERL